MSAKQDNRKVARNRARPASLHHGRLPQERVPPVKQAKAVDVTRNLTYRIILLASTLSRSASRDFEQGADMSVPVWRMLSVIGSRGPIALADIALAIGVDKGWLSRTLAQLEERNFVSRAPDPADGRQFLLTLTAAGRAMHLHGSAISVTRQKFLESCFSASELKTLETLMARLQDAADRLLDKAVSAR